MRFERAQNYEDALVKAADESGIQRDYWDISHRRHEPSTEVRRKILQSLGRDVGSLETLELDRRRAFQGNCARTFQNTIVVSACDPFIPVSYPTGRQTTFESEVFLEEGGSVRSNRSTSELQQLDRSELE